jgi:hypothetical protein
VWSGNAWELTGNVAGHAASHATGGSDAITPAAIGAAATSHTHSAADVTSGTLSDSRLSGNVVLTGDARLTNSRTPTSHASSHTAAGSDPLTITAAQVSGLATVATSGSAADLSGTVSDARLSGNVTLNDNLRWAMQTTSTSIDWLPRGHGTIGNAGTSSGGLMLAFFTAPYSFTATTLTFCTGGTATAGLSVCRFGLFTVSETITNSTTATTPVVTLVARTANDTTIGNTTNTIYSRTFDTTGAYPASYALVGGTRYAVGLMTVGTTAGTWQAGTVTTGAIMRVPPMVAGLVTGLSDIPTAPTSVPNGNFILYGRIS